jgi:predicted solute-binding protein
MNYILLFIAVNLIGLVNSVNNNNNYQLMVRNTALRVLLSNEYKKSQFILRNMKIFSKHIYTKIHDKILSKYYDTCAFYYSISEDDKTMMEAIISLCY